jgi:hypothetical protein
MIKSATERSFVEQNTNNSAWFSLQQTGVIVVQNTNNSAMIKSATEWSGCSTEHKSFSRDSIWMQNSGVLILRTCSTKIMLIIAIHSCSGLPSSLQQVIRALPCLTCMQEVPGVVFTEYSTMFFMNIYRSSLFVVYLMTLSMAQIMQLWMVGLLLNNELETLWKEVIVAWF